MNFNVIEELAEKRFVKLYDELFQEPYNALNNNDRVIYSELVNRSHLSSTNGFIDEEGVFVKYSQSSLAEKVCVSVNTVKKSLKNLEDNNLIKVVNQGKNLPNKVYVYAPTGYQKLIPKESKNDTLRSQKLTPEVSKNGYEKDYIKINNKDYINTNSNNVDANAKQKPKHKTNYIEEFEWIYDLYMQFNNIDKITNNTDYYHLNNLVKDFSRDHIVYYLSRDNKGGFKSTKYIRGVLKKWKGKSLAQIQFEEKEFYKQQEQQKLNEQYSSVNAERGIPTEVDKIMQQYTRKVAKRSKDQEQTSDISDILEEIYEL